MTVIGLLLIADESVDPEIGDVDFERIRSRAQTLADFDPAWPWHAVGVSKTSYRGFPLPPRLDFLGMRGCCLHTSFDVSFGFPVSNGAGSSAFNVPNNPALLKAMVYMQSAAGLKTTNGVEIVVGNR